MALVDGLLNQTIASICSVTKDKYGDETKTVVYTSVPCRWWPKVTQVVDQENELKQSTVEVWIRSDYDIGYDYIIRKGSENYRVLNYETRYDIDGIHDHTKLYLI